MSENKGILGHDPALAKRLLSSFLRLLLWLQAFSVVFLVATTPSLDLPRMISTVVPLASTLVVQQLLKRDRLLPAIHLLLAVLYLAMLPNLYQHGCSVGSILIIPATVPLATLLLGIRYGVGYAALNLGTVGGFWLAEQLGWKTHPNSYPMLNWAFTEILVAFAVVFYQAIPTTGVVTALRSANREEEELVSVIEKLEENNRKLAAEVEIRTQGLREANENLTRLSATLSHDLRIPLRSISSFAKQLSEETFPDAVQAQLASIQSDTASLQLVLETAMQNLRRETQT